MYNNIKFGFRWLIVIVTLLSALQWSQPVQADESASPVYDPANTWYVSTIGSDTNDCATPSTPCLTINKAIGYAADGAVIKITEGSFGNNVLVNKSVTLSGGWDTVFSTNSGGITIIEGKTVNVDDYDYTPTKTVVIDRLTIRNGDSLWEAALTNRENLTISNCEIYNQSNGGGIDSYGPLVVNNCYIHDNNGAGVKNSSSTTINASQISNNNNESTSKGGGVSATSTTGTKSLTITNSLIHGNKGRYGGGGIDISSGISLTVDNSAIYQNSASEGVGGGIRIDGYSNTVNINNTTISKNSASKGGGFYGGDINFNNTTFRNVTLSENSAGSGGGLYGNVILYNSIIAYNTAQNGANNCGPLSTVRAVENNIIYKMDCGELVPEGTVPDYVDVDPLLLPFISAVGYAPLPANSPAVDAGDPASCFGATDQRGTARNGVCDIGAYEYTIPETPSKIFSVGGGRQRVLPTETFNQPFIAILLDANGTPVEAGYEVTFSAPANGPSGFFTSSGLKSETVLTSSDGLAESSLLNANEEIGDYLIAASAPGVSNTSDFLVGNGFWMVSTEGSDANDCMTALTPCQSLNGVLSKPNLFSGDFIRLAAGEYLPVPPYYQTATVRGKVDISGGWDTTFTTQNGISSIPQTLLVAGSGNAHVDRITIKAIPYTAYTGGVVNSGTLFIENSVITGGETSGIMNSGILTVSKTTITKHTDGGLKNFEGGKAIVINSTISANSANQAGGISSSINSTLEIYNSTIADNTATDWGGGGIEGFGGVTIANSIIAGNHSPEPGPYAPAYSPDCRGRFTSLGYNIVGNMGVDGTGKSPSCAATFVESDQWGSYTNPISIDNILLPLTDAGNGMLMHPLTHSSIALNTGSPLSVGSSDPSACPNTDQRGVTRPQGIRCDIGAYEAEYGSFSDVLKIHWAWKYIEAIYSAGITGGCSTNPLMYCPGASVTRAQMAVFLGRGIHGSSFTPLGPTGTVFLDIPTNHWAAAWIEQFASDGITGGCGNGNFCPDYPVTRDQMAIFLLRAEHGKDYIPPAATGTLFGDVPDTFWAAAWIEQLAAEGITGGCGGGNYCPGTPVTRDQMAVFLQRTFSLPLP